MIFHHNKFWWYNPCFSHAHVFSHHNLLWWFFHHNMWWWNILFFCMCMFHHCMLWWFVHHAMLWWNNLFLRMCMWLMIKQSIVSLVYAFSIITCVWCLFHSHHVMMKQWFFHVCVFFIITCDDAFAHHTILWWRIFFPCICFHHNIIWFPHHNMLWWNHHLFACVCFFIITYYDVFSHHNMLWWNKLIFSHVHVFSSWYVMIMSPVMTCYDETIYFFARVFYHNIL